MELSKTELNNVVGGGISAGFMILGGILGGLITFTIGFLDGYTRPMKCN